MKILETEYEKKSFALTTVLFILLFLLLLFLKLAVDTVPDKLEGGGGGEIAINFGNSELGSGKNYQSKDLSAPTVKAIPIKSTTTAEKVLTQETTEAPIISQTKNPEKTITKPIVKEAPKPSKSTSDALSSIMNGSNKSGDGNDKSGGNKGKLNGDPNAKGYNGGGGSGTGTGLGNGSGYGTGSGSGTGSGNGWRLSGRKLSSSGKVHQKCNEYGTVVVQITVNRNGDVIAAKYSKGTTNTDPCLIEPALATAKKHKWQADSNAPETQIGFITVIFKSSE
ncbi:energy transducer TonB family protein [Flavobacterium limnophilum]|uniref:energy transducer TonB family protein n=1 Tax=Flavobacterium limnophilum TaxID=3003262 RepID=UPI002482735E|nr:energy transducer TonB [Flavobacterium limnophilum]